MWRGYHNFIRISSVKQVFVTRYLCANCGFSEEWVEDRKGLELIKKKFGKNTPGSEYV